MYNLLKQFESLGYTILEMDHAYRINGIVDVYKKGFKVYNKSANIYIQAKTAENRLNIILDILQNRPPECAFKKAKHGISYQEFKNNKKRLLTNIEISHAEDYHWKQNIDIVSLDHLYFLFHEGFVKIGRSKDIENRILQLKTALSGAYNLFYIPNKGHLEKILHNCFKEFKTEREWFTSAMRIKLFVDKHAKQHEVSLKQ